MNLDEFEIKIGRREYFETFKFNKLDKFEGCEHSSLRNSKSQMYENSFTCEFVNI